MKPLQKKHTAKKTIKIGYHGNKVHLHCFKPDISWALEQTSKKHDIELVVVYNKNKLGPWRYGKPKNVKIKEVQWSEKSLEKATENIDIGIVNNHLPVNRLGHILTRNPLSFLKNIFLYTSSDFTLRFKYSANPGRSYVFAQRGIPVITDYNPSNAQIIEDGISGFIVGTKEGWLYAFEKLISSHKMRQEMSDKLRARMDGEFSTEQTFKRFNEFLKNLAKKK